MTRKLGEILVEDFGWSEDRIFSALSKQRTETTGQTKIGHFLRADGVKQDVVSSRDIPLALVMQRAERDTGMTPTLPSAMDAIEYGELGEMLRDERRFIDAKMRSYVIVLAGIVLYIAYPLNLVLAEPAARPSEWPGLLVLYSIIGISLVLASLFVGDNVVKGYASFLKRRRRIALARRELRARHVDSGALTPTVMPRREARLRNVPAGSVPERADPEITGMQKMIPFYFSLWSFLKLGLLLYFVACLVGQTFKLSTGHLKIAAGITLVVALFWLHFVAMLCERYHTTVKEARLIGPDNPFPRVSTSALRADPRFQLARWGAVVWHLLTGAVIVAVGGWQLFELRRPDERLLWLMAGVLFLHYVSRLADVAVRMKLAKIGPAATPAPR